MFYTRIPRHIEYAQIGLRQLRFSDIPFLCDGLRDKEILATNGLSKQISLSWLSVWWWIKKTFTLIYCIKCDSKRIGFIGLYNLKLGKSAEMTLVIFDKDMRRAGYGSKAFNIFAQNLKKHSIAEKIIVKVRIDNNISISFWQKLGFKELNKINGIQTMCINLNSYQSCYGCIPVARP
jgi:ribosomal protein S18 acetylase RimI-like enzyme